MSFMFSKESQETIERVLNKLNETRSKSEPVQQGGNVSYSPSNDFQNYQKPEVDLVEDDDLRLIVQLKVESTRYPLYEEWLDTNIDADDLDDYRESFPGSEYRLVAVYDEIVGEVDSVDQRYFNLYDEIESLKEEIVKLKAQISDILQVPENF
jgi:predicted  nucleic acid-binding Zn-ribbon protein